MFEWLNEWLRAATAAGQVLFGTAAIYMLLQLLPRRPARWRRLAALNWKTSPAPEGWLRALRISRSHPSCMEREALLAGCGISADPAWYLLLRKVAIFVLPFMGGSAFVWYGGSLLSIASQLLAGLPLLLTAALLADKAWLRSLRKLRALQMTKEIYRVSNQLLYLSDSALHIHAKLARCVPYTRTIRSDLERLLAEWYHDPSLALQRFKQRIGTDDGMSFVETVDALRLHESREYYDLLRIRIADYKEKLELAKESRKESTSYVLFVLAGIPILYTFQVFIYPWVMEAQQLFQSLG
jgi:hypothetical protein